MKNVLLIGLPFCPRNDVMGYRLSKIYTRTGDDGTTSIEPGKRIPKNHLRLELMGTIDELNSSLGIVASYSISESMKAFFMTVQNELFNLGGELCPPHHVVITHDKIEGLEKYIDTWNDTLPPLKEFILPGGNIVSANCHLARSICRRAERCAVTLHQTENFNLNILQYLNRLSDALFVAARMLAKETNAEEILWEHQQTKI